MISERLSRRPPQAPIALVRNGKEFKVFGDQSTVKAGTEMQVVTEREEVTLSVAEMGALRQAKETSWFNDGDTTWVKLVAAPPAMEVIRPTDLKASITVSR